MSQDKNSIAVGTEVAGRYEVVEKVGDSLSGAVYQAKDHLHYDNLVALRILEKEKLSESGLSKLQDHFFKNGESLLNVAHNNLSQVTDYELFDDELYIVTEFLSGYTLQDFLEDEEHAAQHTEEKFKWFRDICNGVNYLEKKGFAYGMLTPGNIFLEENESSYTPKLINYEFPLLSDDDVKRSLDNLNYYPDQSGSPPYMHALGKVLYDIMCGKAVQSVNALNVPDVGGVAGADIFKIVETAMQSPSGFESAESMLSELEKLFPDFIDLDSLSSDTDENVCHSCSFSNESRIKVCAKCNSSLLVSCPECSVMYAYSEDTCARCRTNRISFRKIQFLTQRMKKFIGLRDPEHFYEEFGRLPEDCKFLGDKGKAVSEGTVSLKESMDEKVAQAKQHRENIEVLLDSGNNAGALEAVEAFRKLVLTDEYVNLQAKELPLRIDEDDYRRVVVKANPFIESKEYLTAINVFQEYLTVHSTGKYFQVVENNIKLNLMEKQYGLEVLSLYGELLEFVDERNFENAKIKSSRLQRVVAKLNGPDDLLDNKKVSGNDIKVKAANLLKELEATQVLEAARRKLFIKVSLAIVFFIVFSGIGLWVYVSTKNKNAFEDGILKAGKLFYSGKYHDSSLVYLKVLKIPGYNSNAQAISGVRKSKAMIVFTSKHAEVLKLYSLMKGKIRIDAESSVNRYFVEAMTAVGEVEKTEVITFLPQEHISRLIELKNNIYESKLDYWQKVINDREWVIPNYRIQFVRVPQGEAVLGSPAEEIGRDDDEAAFNTRVENIFWIGKYEITQQQYRSIMGENPSSFTSLNLDKPIEMVSWADAMKFCERLTEREREIAQLTDDMEYRLPTEVEWEYSCRAGNTKRFSLGNEISFDQVSFSGEGNSEVIGRGREGRRRGTAIIGSFKPNSWGIYDMHGNVSEWCIDSYRTSLGGPEVDSSFKSIRGGSWFDSENECRSASRDRNHFSNAYDCTGFRIVLVKKM